MVQYLEVTVTLPAERQEEYIALFSESGFDSFWQEDDHFKAYTAVRNENQIIELMNELKLTHFTVEPLENRNWNAEWESNYPSVSIDDYCHIYPHFRKPEPGFIQTIQITPKMSFGTGHHETTRNMIRLMRSADFSGKKVLDMGCGTGVLGISAQLAGAGSPGYWVDIDPQCTENTAENVLLNGLIEGVILTGGVEVLPETIFDVILANIQRNVLLEDGSEYARHQVSGGELLISGFTPADVSEVIAYFNSLNYTLAQLLEENNWAAARLLKS